jgi:hypothetical protein
VATPNCAHTHTHTQVPTHTQLISRNGKEIEITHTLAKWGSVSRKIKRKRIEEFSAGVDKWGMLLANREFHVVARVVIFPTHPGSRINLLRAGRLCTRRRLSGRKNAFHSQRVFSQILSQFARVFDLAPNVGFRRSRYRWKACAAYFCKVPDSRKSELGLVRYGPANGGHRSVFGPFEGSFPIGIPASPGKFLAIREFLVVHECVFFPTHLGL